MRHRHDLKKKAIFNIKVYHVVLWQQLKKLINLVLEHSGTRTLECPHHENVTVLNYLPKSLMHIYFFFCLFLKRLTRIGHQAPSWAWRKSQWWWEGWSRANSRCFLPHRWSETDDQIILRNLWSGLLQSCSGASLGPQKPLEHHFLCATPSTRRIFFYSTERCQHKLSNQCFIFSPSPVQHFFAPKRLSFDTFHFLHPVNQKYPNYGLGAICVPPSIFQRPAKMTQKNISH